MWRCPFFIVSLLQRCHCRTLKVDILPASKNPVQWMALSRNYEYIPKQPMTSLPVQMCYCDWLKTVTLVVRMVRGYSLGLMCFQAGCLSESCIVLKLYQCYVTSFLILLLTISGGNCR